MAQPTLVYLYGPPASGKLTIAERLVPLTGYRLFHNHLTVNAIRSVFEFGSPMFTEVLHRVRLDVFTAAMQTGISVIFTNNSAWGGPDPRARFDAFAARCEAVVNAAGGRTVFVQLTAPAAVLEDRLGNDSRRGHEKLVDVTRLRELLAVFDATPLHETDLTIDTSTVPADEAAQLIARATVG